MCMHSGLSAFSLCCIHVHSLAPMHSHAFREGCIFTTVHSSYMCMHSMIVHFYRHALWCIWDSLHSWLLHSVASRCILCYLHSRPCAYRCIRLHSITRCIIMHVRFVTTPELLCICDSLHSCWLHYVAFSCITFYLHSRPCAYRCIRSHSMTHCILVFLCIRIHSNAQNSHTFWCIRIHSHAFTPPTRRHVEMQSNACTCVRMHIKACQMTAESTRGALPSC